MIDMTAEKSLLTRAEKEPCLGTGVFTSALTLSPGGDRRNYSTVNLALFRKSQPIRAVGSWLMNDDRGACAPVLKLERVRRVGTLPMSLGT